MLAKKTVSGDDGPLDTLIGPSAFFEGTLKADNGVRVEGGVRDEESGQIPEERLADKVAVHVGRCRCVTQLSMLVSP